MRKLLPFIFILSVLLQIALLTKGSGNVFVYLQTDRFCYVSGDLAFIKIYHWENSNAIQINQTVYVDLVSSDSLFICGELLELSHGMASGYFTLPDTLQTGKYDFRVYTDRSKMDSNPVLARTHLYISNRFGKNEILYYNSDSTGEMGSNLNRSSDTIHPNALCSLTLKQDTVQVRKKVNLELDASFLDGADAIRASLTVKPVSSIEQRVENENSRITDVFDKESIVASTVKPKQKLFRGVNIQGTLVNDSTGEPVSNAVVFLSFQDTILRFKYDLTDAKGNFKFTLTHAYGNRTAFLTAFKYPDLVPLEHVRFQIHDNFLQPVLSSTGEKKMSGYHASSDTLNVLKSIISKAYQYQYFEFTETPLLDTFSYEQHYFAGRFNDVVFPDDYVTLPDFVEVAREILPFVRYKKSGGKFRFSVLDGINNTVRREPLVLVDGIPLLDINKIADWGTLKIKRVEVRAEPRFYGDLFFDNGIILIWTKEHNFWALNSTDANREISIQFYEPSISIKFPDYSVQHNYNLPDFRQTLYWNPDIQIDKNKSVNLEFYSSDEKGTFEIIFEGVSAKGQPVYICKTFTVE